MVNVILKCFTLNPIHEEEIGFTIACAYVTIKHPPDLNGLKVEIVKRLFFVYFLS